jgi:uncharacterized Tic20 family protein
MDTSAPAPAPPTVPASTDSGDKALAVLCHVSLFIGVGFLLPFIVYLVKRDESPFVGFHAREVLNFHLSLLLYFVCTLPFLLILTCLFLPLGLPLYMALGLMAFICAIIGAIRASEGAYYLYPLTIRFV